jgi:hypothetical protein
VVEDFGSCGLRDVEIIESDGLGLQIFFRSARRSEPAKRGRPHGAAECGVKRQTYGFVHGRFLEVLDRM